MWCHIKCHEFTLRFDLETLVYPPCLHLICSSAPCLRGSTEDICDIFSANSITCVVSILILHNFTPCAQLLFSCFFAYLINMSSTVRHYALSHELSSAPSHWCPCVSQWSVPVHTAFPWCPCPACVTQFQVGTNCYRVEDYSGPRQISWACFQYSSSHCGPNLKSLPIKASADRILLQLFRLWWSMGSF